MNDKRNLVHTQFAQRSESSDNPALAWFRSARFGMFVHWGLYALPAGVWHGKPSPHMGEWIMHDLRIPAAEYKELAASFNPQNFNATALVELAVRAGQRYVVLTAKHHEGFCLWNTALTDFNSVAGAPFGRDVVAEISQACHDQGIAFGLYYSQTQDWTHPDGAGNDWDFDPATKDFEGYLQTYVKPQLTELLTDYGPIALIWFDTPQEISADQSRDLVEHVHRLQPECLVNGRVGNGLGDYGQTADNDMPDAPPGDWETPITGNETWGFTTTAVNWKSAKVVAETIAQAASLGGNVLLNVGPDSHGIIPEAQHVELRDVGDWMLRCGKSIYGTVRGPLQGLEWGWSTADGDSIYLHVRDWPATSRLEVPAGVSFATAHMLSDSSVIPVLVAAADSCTVLDLKGIRPDPVLSVIELVNVVEKERK